MSGVAAQQPAPPCEPREPPDVFPDELTGPVKVMRTFETWFVVSKKTGRLEKQPRRLESEIKFEPDEPLMGTGRGYGGGAEVSTVQYVCDKAGNVIEETTTTQVHPEHFTPKRYDVYVTTKAAYKYDARRNMIEEKHFSQNGAVSITWFYNYDEQDRLIKKSRLDNLGRLEDQSFYEYHANGSLLVELEFHNFCITRDGEFCKGNISSGDGFFHYATKIKYDYDSQGNWVKQTELHMDGELKRPTWQFNKIVEREITYYRR